MPVDATANPNFLRILQSPPGSTTPLFPLPTAPFMFPATAFPHPSKTMYSWNLRYSLCSLLNIVIYKYSYAVYGAV